jgi:hypothetical protein
MQIQTEFHKILLYKSPVCFFEKFRIPPEVEKHFCGHPNWKQTLLLSIHNLGPNSGPKEPLVWLRELEHAANPLTVTFFPMSSSPLKPHIILFHNLLLPGWARLPILIMENVEVIFRLLVSKTADDAPELLLGVVVHVLELGVVRLAAIVCPCCDLTRSKNAEHISAVST